MATQRQLAVASENNEARKPTTALDAMAHRLQISPGGLMATLKSTVFAKASSDEFMALVVVCNEYGLNPMLKEIYAFPAKGGGIVPMVSVDGWIRIMNSHPMFDGIEFDYINDSSGKTIAIEAVIHRKDRNRPIKVMEYLAECAGQTEPWRKSPFRMLRHRALIQCARVAFGFSGIASDGDEGEYIEGQIIDRQVSLPRQSVAEELDDEIPDHETGELSRRDARGMTEVDEETARQADAGYHPEGRANEDMGEGFTDDQPAWAIPMAVIRKALSIADNTRSVTAAETEFLNIKPGLPDDIAASFEIDLAEKRKFLRRG